MKNIFFVYDFFLDLTYSLDIPRKYSIKTHSFKERRNDVCQRSLVYFHDNAYYEIRDKPFLDILNIIMFYISKSKENKQ